MWVKSDTNTSFNFQARRVTDDELRTVHDAGYVEKIKQTSGKPPKDLLDLADSFNSIYLHPKTWSSAQLAAGCVLEVSCGNTVNF